MCLALEYTNPQGRGRLRLLQNLEVVYFGWNIEIKIQSQTFELRLLHLETIQLNLGQTLCVVHEIALYCSLY